MNAEVLISTMNINNKEEHEKLLRKMNIKGNSVVINQCPFKRDTMENIETGKSRIFSFNDKGLSKSRNLAIQKSSSTISIIADDDLKYVDDYEEIIISAYKTYPKADIIVFYVSSDNPNNIKDRLKKGKITILDTFKIQSVQMTLKTESIKRKKIKFDEEFGAGSDYYMGEENIFLFDCIKSKLKIYSCPIEIAKLNNRESTWFKGYNKEYFQAKGACFYRINRFLWPLLVLQFIIRKKEEYERDISPKAAFKNMIVGMKQYKETEKKK